MPKFELVSKGYVGFTKRQRVAGTARGSGASWEKHHVSHPITAESDDEALLAWAKHNAMGQKLSTVYEEQVWRAKLSEGETDSGFSFLKDPPTYVLRRPVNP